MKTIVLFLTLYLFTACTSSSLSSVHEPLSLQKKLEEAKQEREGLDKKVASLEIALAKKEIARIRKEVKAFKEEKESLADHEDFKIHREKLAAIIQNVPDCAPEAQGVLDQILALITRLKDVES